jgi:PHD/YefM family antitoxin component YafN of YafNO toxin-antitoxin module
MPRTLSMGEARDRLTRLPEELTQDDHAETAIITRRGEPVLAVLSWEFYESLIETLEIMGDPEQMALLRQGIQDVAEGRTQSWESVKAELHLDDAVDDSTDDGGD